MTYRTFHSNGVVDTRTADPKGMARPRKISTSGIDQKEKVPGTALQNCGALSGIVRQSGAWHGYGSTGGFVDYGGVTW